MKNIERVLLCGLGAVGAVYADKFHRHDPDNFRVLLDKDRLPRYLANPIKFNGRELNFNYILPDDEAYKADLIVIATKITGLNEAIREIKNFVHEDTVILPLLNGVTSERIIADFYGWKHVLYAYFIGHSSIRTGNSVCHDDINTLVFGSDLCPDERVEKVKEYLEKANINYNVPEDIKYALWLKFMLNVCANPTTALLRMTFGEMTENQHFMQLAVKIMKEVQSAAKFEGVKNTEIMIEESIQHLQTMTPDGRTSMLQDVEAGRHTEIEMFAGTIIEFGKKYNFPTPYCCFLKELFDIIHENQDIKRSRGISTLHKSSIAN